MKVCKGWQLLFHAAGPQLAMVNHFMFIVLLLSRLRLLCLIAQGVPVDQVRMLVVGC